MESPWPAHQAAGRDDLLLDDGDVEGAAVWRMIMGTIAERSATELPCHIHGPTRQFLDDPEMSHGAPIPP
jgi:hypothetical protein